MSRDRFDAPGALIEISALVVPKSRQLAEFLASNVHPHARFLEARVTELPNRLETVVLEVDVEVGQIPLRDIRAVEKIAVTFCESDRFWPEVLALRIDFPRDVSHLFPRPEGMACSLCIYEDSYEELRLRWAAVSVVEQIRFWLRETSRGTLHGADQPLEPLFAGQYESLILPIELFSSGTNTAEHISIFCPDPTAARKVYIATQGVRPQGLAIANCVATVFIASPRVQRAIRSIPTNLLELDVVTQTAGLDLVGQLRKRLGEWNRETQLLSSQLIVIVAFPRVREEKPLPEATELWAFVTGQNVAQIGQDFSLWQVLDGKVGALIGVTFDPAKTVDIILAPLNPCLALSRELAAAANGVAPDPCRITAIGMGALGSQIVGTLIRMGCGQWKLVDEDVLMPHNVARHELPHSAAGLAKARAMTDWANGILADRLVDEGIVADVLAPGESGRAVANALETADVIADFSASQAVARHLARDVVRTARCVSCFMNPSGTDVVVLAEDAQRKVPLDSIEMQYYRLLLTEPNLAAHFKFPDGKIRVGRSCRDISTILPSDAVSHRATIASRGFRAAIDEDGASIRVWTTDDCFNTRMFQHEPAPVIECLVDDYRLVTDEMLMKSVRAHRERRLPKETGGVLLGSWDFVRKIVYVASIIASPEDSEEYPTSYIRGCDGLLDAVRNASARTGGQLRYVGEWHSHPDGYSAKPSEDDSKLFAWLEDHLRQDGCPAVMLIEGEHESRWLVGHLGGGR